MTTTEILAALKEMTIAERLEIIETASKLIREELVKKAGHTDGRQMSLAAAVEVMRPYYEQGSKLAMFTDLDSEDFYEYKDYA